jgi:hypothetical protein
MVERGGIELYMVDELICRALGDDQHLQQCINNVFNIYYRETYHNAAFE